MGWDWERIARLLCGEPTGREYSTWLDGWALRYAGAGVSFVIGEQAVHVQFRRPDGQHDGLHIEPEGAPPDPPLPVGFLLRLLGEGLAQVSAAPCRPG